MNLKSLKSSFNWMNRLGKRERIVLKAGSAFFLLCLVYFLAVSPFLGKMEGYDRKIRQKEKDLSEMAPLREEYQKLNRRINRFELKMGPERKDFSFPSYLENAAVETQLKNRMTSLRPQSSQNFENLKFSEIEVKLEDVTLKQAVAFLSKIESAPAFLYIKNLHMKTRYSDPRNLDLTLIVSYYEKAP